MTSLSITYLKLVHLIPRSFKSLAYLLGLRNFFFVADAAAIRRKPYPGIRVFYICRQRSPMAKHIVGPAAYCAQFHGAAGGTNRSKHRSRA